MYMTLMFNDSCLCLMAVKFDSETTQYLKFICNFTQSENISQIHFGHLHEIVLVVKKLHYLKTKTNFVTKSYNRNVNNTFRHHTL